MVQTTLDHLATKPGRHSPPLPGKISQESLVSFSWRRQVTVAVGTVSKWKSPAGFRRPGSVIVLLRFRSLDREILQLDWNSSREVEFNNDIVLNPHDVAAVADHRNTLAPAVTGGNGTRESL